MSHNYKHEHAENITPHTETGHD